MSNDVEEAGVNGFVDMVVIIAHAAKVLVGFAVTHSEVLQHSTFDMSNATSCLLLRHVACCRSTCCVDMLLVWTGL